MFSVVNGLGDFCKLLDILHARCCSYSCSVTIFIEIVEQLLSR